jgi:hypothetical protein
VNLTSEQLDKLLDVANAAILTPETDMSVFWRHVDAFNEIIEPEIVAELVQRVKEANRWKIEIEENLDRPTRATIIRDGVPVFIGSNDALRSEVRGE